MPRQISEQPSLICYPGNSYMQAGSLSITWPCSSVDLCILPLGY